MDKKIKVLKAGFEVLESNESRVTFKRVVAPKGRKAKELHKIEMGLPKVTMTYFTDADLSRLRVLEDKISGKLVVAKKGKLEKVIHGLKRIMVE